MPLQLIAVISGMHMLYSLFSNNRSSKIRVYVLHQGLTEEDKRLLNSLAVEDIQKIEYLKIDMESRLMKLPITENWTREIYFRLLMGEVLPQIVNRVLYLDIDIIVHASIKEFYNMDMQGMELAVADDPMIQGNYSKEQKELFAEFGEELRYFNSGMILYDLDKVRKRCCFEDYYRIAERAGYSLTNPDQDLLNYLHFGNVLYVDNTKYNVFSQNVSLNEETLSEMKIIHFAGRKPWKYSGVHYEMEKIWWLYAKETPFYIEMMEEVFWDGLSDDSYQTIRALLQENKELKDNLNKAMELCQRLCGR